MFTSYLQNKQQILRKTFTALQQECVDLNTRKKELEASLATLQAEKCTLQNQFNIYEVEFKAAVAEMNKIRAKIVECHDLKDKARRSVDDGEGISNSTRYFHAIKAGVRYVY